MAAGARLAAERDRWPAQWHVGDLDPETDHLLDTLEDDEELGAVVPGLVSPDPPAAALIAVTTRRVLVLTRDAGDTVAVTDATSCLRRSWRGGPLALHGSSVTPDVDGDELDRLWSIVDDLLAS